MKTLIIGNGISRKNYLDYIHNFDGLIYTCNYSYLEFNDFKRIDILGTVHFEVALKALEYRKFNNLKYEILSIKNKDEIKQFTNFVGWSTGNELIKEAILRDCCDIHLLGFDSLNNIDDCIYSGKVVISNFKCQMNLIIKRYGLKLLGVNKDIFRLIRT